MSSSLAVAAATGAAAPARLAVPFQVVSALGDEFGAYECCWRESERSFSGWVAEVWLPFAPGEFCRRFASVCGYHIRVRCFQRGAQRYWVASVPCQRPPEGEVGLGWASRGSRVELRYTA